jgi:23S rRNA (adenine-N6)-dimethyltransferase
MKKSIAYSQNLLINDNLIEKLVSLSTIDLYDTVLEIGAGKGIITKQLLKKAGNVVVFEIDEEFVSILKSITDNKLVVKNGNFLDFDLPKDKYKVFANIPFNKTSVIIKRLLFSNNSPTDTYLVVQKEAVDRFAGKPFDNKNSLLSVLFNPWFEFSITHEFNRTDFKPTPNVDTVLLNIKLKNNTKILDQDKETYRDFVVFGFNQMAPNTLEGLSKVINKNHIIKLFNKLNISTNLKPTELEKATWIEIFDLLKYQKQNKRNLIKNSYIKWVKQQENIEKINRTRNDTDWKNYK